MAIIEISDYEQWKQQQAQRTAAGANVVLGSIDTKPDDVAGDMNLGQEFAKTTGQPVPPLPMVTEYRPVFQQAIERSRNATILSSSPMLASWLKKPENAAIARDDLEGLAAIEGLVRRPAKTEYTTEELAQMAPAGRMADAFRMGEATAITQGQSLTRDLAATLEAGPLGRGLDAARGTMDDALLTGDDGQPNLIGRLANFARSRAEAADGVPRSMVGGPDVALDDRVAGVEGAEFNEFYRGAEALLSEMDERGFSPMMYNEVDGIGSAFRFIGESLSMSLPQMGVALASGAFAPLLQITMLGGEANEELKERTDLTRDQRVAVSLGAGTVMTALETFGLSKIFGALPVSQIALDAVDGTLTQKLVQNGLSQAAARVLTAGIAEGSTELLQEGIVLSVTALAGGEYTREEVIDRLAQGFFAGAGSGGALRTGGEALSAGKGAVERYLDDQAKAQDAEGRQTMFQELSGQAVNSRLRARMPDAFRQFVERATENGPVENVFVPAEKFQEYFQGIGTDPFALADTLDGVTSDMLRDALATGGDLQIPTATYAASIAGSEHDAFLMENMRFDPDEFTSFEAREFNEKAQQALDEAYAEADRMRAEGDRFRTFEQEIYDTMVERLRVAGRSSDVATSEAMLYPAFYRTMAERSGMPIDELMQRYPLPQVQGELPQGIQSRNVDELTRTLAEARSQRQVNTGPRTPLLEFISDYGGMIDPGGELASRDAAVIQRGRGRKNLRLARDPNTRVSSASAEASRAFGVDDVAQAAIEAGFMADNPLVMEYQEAMRTGREVPDITRALFDEIDRELRGEASLTQDELRDGVNDDTLGGLEEYLSRIGMSLDDSDADIRAAIERDQAEQGRMYGQDGQIATDSEAFKAWFGDSKVVDADGEPLVVYHGTPSDVDGGFAFDLGRVGERDEGFYGRGVYLTPDQETAESYSSNEDGDVGNTIEAFVSLQNPFVWDGRTDESRAATAAALAEMGIRRDADALTGSNNDSLGNSDERRKFNAAVRAAGYDGVMVYSRYGDDQTPSEIVAFTPTQIKSVNNRGTFDANDPRILFQGAADQAAPEIDRPLYVVHNLSATKLEYATDLGGLAAPSLAIARGDIGFDNFGEISLIGDPSMADPKRKGVRAFNADVYSPRQPRAQFKVKERDADRVFKAMRSVADDLGFEGRLDTSDLSSQGASAIEANVAIKAAWLRDQGEPLPVQYDDPIPAPVPVAGYEQFTSTDFIALFDDPAFQATVQGIKDAFVAERADTVTPEQMANIRARLFDENGKVTDETIASAAKAVERRNMQIASYVPSDRGSFNKYRTSIAIDEQIAGREDAYSAWVRSEFGDVIGDAYFEDANGRRREYTMANIVREMTRGLRDAEGFNYGVGNVRATVAPEFKTMTEIKAARGQVVDSETMDRLKTEVGDELFALADKFAPYHSSGQGFGWGDIFTEFLKDMGKSRRFVEEWQTTIFVEPVPDTLLAEAAAYLQKLRDLPTEYFEIKMQRAVGIDEFKVALVPEKASDATVKTLTDAGLEVLRYGVEGRQAALQRVAGKVFFQPAYHGSPHLFEKFSLSAIGTGEGAQAFGWGLYFAGRREVAEWYRGKLSGGRAVQINGERVSPEWAAGEAGQQVRQTVPVDQTDFASGEETYAYYLRVLQADAADAMRRVEQGRDDGKSVQELFDQNVEDRFRVDPPYDDEATSARRMASAMRDGLSGVTVAERGRLFEVNIPEDAELLDWDAPLSEQPAAVREKLQPMLDRVREIDRAFIADQRQAEREAATSAPISDEMAALLDDLDLPDVSPEEQAATDAAAAAREAERVETLLNLKWGDSKKVMGLHAELAGFFAENDAAWSLIGKTPDDVMNTQQAASEILRDAGIPGHRYLDGGSRADGDGSYNYVIYDDSRIDVARFEQENRGSIQFPGAGVGNGDTVINLFRKADLSTFLHESGHYFLTVLQDMARQGETSAVAELDVIKSEWRKNAGAVAADAMRVMPDVTITEADVNTALDNGTTGDVLKDAAIDVGMQEQFARGFERYLMEGKAPTQELRSAFEKFRAWLMSVYKSLRGLNVEISDEMRAVFDRMLATDAEIATASEASGDAGPLFASAEDMGLSADDYAAFLRLTQQANDEASAKLLAETMAPIRRETEKWFKDERAKVRADVEREVNAYRQYRALEWMGNRRWLGEGKPEALGDFRLSKDMLVERYGVGVLKTLPRGKQTVYAVEGGIDPDVAADLFGYSSADEMIKSMEQAPPRREAIEAETDRKMFELHGDPLKDGSVQQQALDAVHGDKRARALAVELKALADIAGSDRGMTHKEAREIARQTLNRTKVRDAIASNRYLSAERKAGEEARRLSATVTRTGMWANAARRRVGVQARAGVREGDTAAPARVAAQVDRANTSTARYNENVTALVEAKRRQLMNHALYSEARRIEAEVQSAERLVTRLSKKSTREKLAGDYLEAIDELLTRYDFRRMSGRAEDRRGALAAFIERMTAEGRENELAIPDRVLQDSARTPYKKLTVEHLRGVVDSLKNIEHTARLKKTLQDAQSQRELDAVVDDITAAFDKNLPKRPPARVGDNAEGRRNTVRRFLDLVLNATTLLREIDGREDFGPAYRNIKAPIDAAMNRLQGRRQKAATDLDALYEVYTKQERRAMAVREFIPEVDASLSKWERIAVALNMGNEGNYQRMTDTNVRGGFTEAQVDAIVATLDARDAAFVQSVWDYLETFRPDIEAREKRTTGVAPKWVEPRAVTIAGETLNGGYYPLRYDPRLSALARDDQAQDISKSLQAGRFGKAQTRNGHLKERAQSSGRAVELDISVLHQHVQQVVYDIELSEPVNNSWRILQDSRIREAFTDTGKQADFDALEVWLKDVAEGEIRSSDAVGKMSRRFKSNFTAAKLAFNMSTVAVQITGVAQSMVVVGKKDFLNGVVASMRPGVEAEVIAKSQFMRDRQTTFNKDIFDLYNDPKMGPTVGRWTELRNEWIAPAGLYLMTKVQFYSVDLPSWMAGYQQGLRKFDNNEDMAIAFADDVVKRAQASGLFSDRSAIERGSTSMAARQNDFIRLFTTLGSYMFAKFNVAYERTQRASGTIRDEGVSMRSVQEAFSWTIDMAFLFTLEAVLYMAIKGRLPDEDDEDDDWATFLARETALSVVSTIPFVRDLGGIYAGFSGGGAYGAMTEELTRPFQQAAQGELDRPFVKSIINATGLFTGLPTGQINRAVDAGWRAAEGEDVSPFEYLLGRMGN